MGLSDTHSSDGWWVMLVVNARPSERNQNRNLHVLDIGQKLKVESYNGYYLLNSILF